LVQSQSDPILSPTQYNSHAAAQSQFQPQSQFRSVNTESDKIKWELMLMNFFPKLMNLQEHKESLTHRKWEEPKNHSNKKIQKTSKPKFLCSRTINPTSQHPSHYHKTINYKPKPKNSPTTKHQHETPSTQQTEINLNRKRKRKVETLCFFFFSILKFRFRISQAFFLKTNLKSKI
jgi:hypothetical protein